MKKAAEITIIFFVLLFIFIIIVVIIIKTKTKTHPLIWKNEYTIHNFNSKILGIKTAFNNFKVNTTNIVEGQSILINNINYITNNFYNIKNEIKETLGENEDFLEKLPKIIDSYRNANVFTSSIKKMITTNNDIFDVLVSLQILVNKKYVDYLLNNNYELKYNLLKYIFIYMMFWETVFIPFKIELDNKIGFNDNFKNVSNNFSEYHGSIKNLIEKSFENVYDQWFSVKNNPWINIKFKGPVKFVSEK